MDIINTFHYDYLLTKNWKKIEVDVCYKYALLIGDNIGNIFGYGEYGDVKNRIYTWPIIGGSYWVRTDFVEECVNNNIITLTEKNYEIYLCLLDQWKKNRKSKSV